jgi:hypothetical protein
MQETDEDEMESHRNFEKTKAGIKRLKNTRKSSLL